MFAYAFDDQGILQGRVKMQLDPMETKAQKKQVFLLPANATLEAPPEDLGEGEVAKWSGSFWVRAQIEKPQTPIKEPDLDTEEKQDAAQIARARWESSPRPQSLEEIADRLEDLSAILGLSPWTTSEKKLEP